MAIYEEKRREKMVEMNKAPVILENKFPATTPVHSSVGRASSWSTEDTSFS